MATCRHEVEYGKCLICFREWLEPKITLTCPTCASKDAELSLLRLIAARAEDVEGLSKRVKVASLDPEMFTTSLDESVFIARAVRAYLKEGR